jgi:hypothetical protein
MPNDRSGVLRPRNAWMSQLKALNTLGIEMDFAMLVARETLKQFGDGTLGAVPAVNKR